MPCTTGWSASSAEKSSALQCRVKLRSWMSAIALTSPGAASSIVCRFPLSAIGSPVRDDRRGRNGIRRLDVERPRRRAPSPAIANWRRARISGAESVVDDDGIAAQRSGDLRRRQRPPAPHWPRQRLRQNAPASRPTDRTTPRLSARRAGRRPRHPWPARRPERRVRRPRPGPMRHGPPVSRSRPPERRTREQSRGRRRCRRGCR